MAAYINIFCDHDSIKSINKCVLVRIIVKNGRTDGGSWCERQSQEEVGVRESQEEAGVRESLKRKLV